jgi:hypothetical protein
LLFVRKFVFEKFILAVTFDDIVSWGSSVSILSDYKLDEEDLIPSRGKGFFLWPLCPDQL